MAGVLAGFGLFQIGLVGWAVTGVEEAAYMASLYPEGLVIKGDLLPTPSMVAVVPPHSVDNNDSHSADV